MMLLAAALLCAAAVRAEAPRSDYARDMLLGPVKYVVQEGDTVRLYGPDGSDRLSRVEQTTYGEDTRTDEIWGEWPTYTFDKRGRVVKVTYSGGETEYRYKGRKFLPVWMKESYEEGEMGDEQTVVREGKLTYPRVDSYGNWLERRFDGETTVREIVYYDAAEVAALPAAQSRGRSGGDLAVAIH